MALACAKDNFERLMSVIPEGRKIFFWWINYIQESSNPICMGEPILTTDASLEGWRVHRDLQMAGSRWLDSEKDDHDLYQYP